MGQGVPLETYKRGQLAEITGCNGETIRYYEKTGLLPAPTRGTNGYRYYDQDHLKCLGFIMKSKSLGFSNDNIRELLKISRGIGEHTRAEILNQKPSRAGSSKNQGLKKIEKTLGQISQQCDGAKESADYCPILLSLFEQIQSSKI
jgi:MerR family mercuric resistance operon transcriptional regulator